MRISRVHALFSTIHSKICIIGGGTAGLNVSRQLLKSFKGSEIRVFDPSTTHYYQPGFTTIGGGLANPTVATRPQSEVLSKDIAVTFQAITKVDPSKNMIYTDKGEEHSYDHLIIATGIQLNWAHIKGAKEAVDDPNSAVCSIYFLDGAIKTNRLASEFKGGKAIFT